jgi:hypothetical protein
MQSAPAPGFDAQNPTFVIFAMGHVTFLIVHLVLHVINAVPAGRLLKRSPA